MVRKLWRRSLRFLAPSGDLSLSFFLCDVCGLPELQPNLSFLLNRFDAAEHDR
jgi:hypothetical protein